MRFKSDVGSGPPPFKRVVMLTAHWAGFMKMLLLYIYLIIFVLILISIVLNIYEKRFKQNLLSNQSLEKLKN